MVLSWLIGDPMLTCQQDLLRLEREQPGLYGGSLRTLQRRMADWRVAHAGQVGDPADGGDPRLGEQPDEKNQEQRPLRR